MAKTCQEDRWEYSMMNVREYKTRFINKFTILWSIKNSIFYYDKVCMDQKEQQTNPYWTFNTR